MLQELHIENFALIDELVLEFAPGLNVLTGETGAGKSILIEALRTVLGGRVQTLQIRDPSKICRIQALFNLRGEKDAAADSQVAPFVEPEDLTLVFARELSVEGRGKLTLNGRLVNAAQAREIGSRLLTIHGQYDHQQILDASAHAGLLDAYLKSAGSSHFQSGLAQYSALYEEYSALVETLRRLKQGKDTAERELDLLQFQISEIEKFKPTAGELDALRQEKIKLANAEKLSELAGRVLDELEEGETSASGLISRSFRPLGDWLRLDPSAGPFWEKLEPIQLQLEELLRDIRHYREDLTADPDRLEFVQDRLSGLERLVKKYGSAENADPIQAVLNFYKQALKRRDELSGSGMSEEDTAAQLSVLEPKLAQAAARLTELRLQGSQKLSRGVLAELKDLGFQHARFECRVTRCDFMRCGCDHVEFFLSANAGQEPLPLSEVASGGEAARIMLALKKILAAADGVPSLIFDEIDANIGGRLGTVVGEKIRDISRAAQVLLITHLPQIASYANRHIQVLKTTSGKVTRVHCRILEGDDKVRELAQMMSGSRETKIAKTHAEEMLKIAGGGDS